MEDTEVILTALPIPMWDTEILDVSKSSPNEKLRLELFKHGIDGPMKMVDKKKTNIDTTMIANGMLPLPREFTLKGFNLFLDESATSEEQLEIFGHGVFYFSLHQRVLAEFHLSQFPRPGGTRRADQEKMIPFHMGDKEKAADFYRLRPTEHFLVQIEWNTPPKISRPLSIRCFLEGTLWLPL